jgi:hypothetical protein
LGALQQRPEQAESNREIDQAANHAVIRTRARKAGAIRRAAAA